MSSIVKVPTNTAFDYDFIAFSFKGKHSYEDFGIYRVAKSGFYEESLTPPLQDTTAEASGIDGTYFLNTTHQPKIFNIDIAFDNLTERQLRDMKIWLDGREVGDLWFAEAPYRVYSAKVTGQPKLSVIPFSDPTWGRIYKGEGTIEFTCYYPYAHTPDYIQVGATQLDGRVKENYAHFNNYLQLQSVLPGSGTTPYGELPFFFVADLDASDPSKSTREDKLTSIFEVSETGNSVTISNTDYEGVPVRGTVVLGGE